MIFTLIAFVVLLVFGIIMGELQWLHVLAWLLTAVGVFVAIQLLHWHVIAYFSILAVMDIILVLIIFKGDIQIR